jgi:uncharacterized protein
MAKIILAGGSGFLGRLLTKWYLKKNYDVVILSRSSKNIRKARVIKWNGENIGDWIEELENSTALINLSGRSVNCRYNKKNKQEILNSRIKSTKVLGKAISSCKNPPQIWLNLSTATIYEHTYENAHGENGIIKASVEAKDAFSIEVAKKWEESFQEIQCPYTRKIILRTAMVFGNEPGGVFSTLNFLSKIGLGGKMHHGKQMVSWIHADDFCRAIDFLIENQNANGIYNISSPYPLTNEEMMQHIRKYTKVPFGLPATLWMLELGAIFLRTETELIIKSRNVIPEKILNEGFVFTYPKFENALQEIYKGSSHSGQNKTVDKHKMTTAATKYEHMPYIVRLYKTFTHDRHFFNKEDCAHAVKQCTSNQPLQVSRRER